MTLKIARQSPRIEYPESDGKPMAETDVHRRELINAIDSLSEFFRHEPEVYVAGNLLLYYEEGNPRASVAPDVFVVKGVSRRLRRVYKLWEEGRAPNLVIEMTSRSTRREDLGDKRSLYAALGVAEYFLFDPLEEYLEPSLQGYRLVGREYVPLEPDAVGRFYSGELGLWLLREANQLRFFDPARGQKLPTYEELQRMAQAAERRAQAEAAARTQAEAEVERLRAELARLRQQRP